MRQTLILILGCKPLTLTPIYRIHIHFRLTHLHNTFFLLLSSNYANTKPLSYFFLYSFSVTQHIFLIDQLVSALQWANNQNRWRRYVLMSQPDVLSNKAKPHTWSLDKKYNMKAKELTKKEVQHALQQYHMSKKPNYKTQLSTPQS